jgi:Protein of unknown function (DUF3237)
MQDKCYGSKNTIGDSRLPTSGAPPLSHLPGFADAAAAQSAAPKESEIWGPRSDARQSGSPPSALRLRDPSVEQAAPSSPFLMTNLGDLVTRALVMLAEEGRRMAGASGPQSPGAEHLVNCPSCGLVNKNAARFCGSCGSVLPHPPGASLASDSAPATTTTSLTLQTKETPAATAARTPSTHRARDGSELRSGKADTFTPPDLSGGKLRWDWDTTFLWAGTVAIRKEVIGAMPDGLRINWHVTEGRFAGPRFEGVVLPGGANWLRIRKDGVAIVKVTECLQTPTGTRVDCLYDGILDLGADGYGRAMRGDFGVLPPFVLAPTYATADKELAWLNRAQCIGVGRVDMKRLRAEYDVYVVSVGDRIQVATRPGTHLWRRANGA